MTSAAEIVSTAKSLKDEAQSAKGKIACGAPNSAALTDITDCLIDLATAVSDLAVEAERLRGEH
jgi:hypothetical protein